MIVRSETIPFDEELLPARRLAAGKLTCLYEHGRLRYLKYGEMELIRMIYFAVRNKDWKTAPYEIEKENIQNTGDGFLISYSAIHHLEEIVFRTDVIINASNQMISFHVKGEALSSFQRNRIGICVLHPINEYSGKTVDIIKPEGSEYHSQFPDLIAPHQPFKQIQRMDCQVSNDFKTSLIFEGDVFETEDQRNWADSTFKTYSTPLDISIPVDVPEGAIIEQKVQFSFTGQRDDRKAETKEIERKISFPKIGYECKDKEQLSNEEINLLDNLPFDHYRVELSLYNPGWQDALHSRLDEAKKLDTTLELILIFNDDFKIQVRYFLAAIENNSSLIKSILPLHVQHAITPVNLLQFSYEEIKKKYPDIQIGYGTNGFFADLNRNRPVAMDFDFVSFSLSPQVHAFDTRSLVENLERQKDLIRTTRIFAGDKEIHISPITLKIRESPNENTGRHADADLRQHRNLGAWWTLCSIKNMAEAGHLTFYHTKGYRGIINHESANSDQSPLYKMLKTIKTFNPKWIINNDYEQKPLSGKIVLENEEGNRLEFILTAGNIFFQ